MKFRSWIILENKQAYINQSKNILKKLGIHEVDAAIQEIEQFVRSLDCSNKKQFVPVVALFYDNKPLVFTVINKLSKINDKHKIDIKYNKEKQEYYVFVHSTQESFYNKDFIKFMDWIDGEYYAKEYEKLKKQTGRANNDFYDMKKIASSNNIDVYEVRDVFDSIKLGRDYSFCISQPGANNAYYVSRIRLGNTFYFVFDKNRDRSDPLHVVVVGVKGNWQDANDENTIHHLIELTDAKNTTGTIDHPERPGYRRKYTKEYLEYLKKNGIDITIFKHKPLTDNEKEEYKMIGTQKDSLQEFKDLPVEYKIKYVQFMHELTPDQIEYILDETLKGKTPFKFMLEFYLDTGYPLPDYILYKLYNLIHNHKKGKRQWLKTYLRKRNMLIPDYYSRGKLKTNWFEIILFDKYSIKRNFSPETYLKAFKEISENLKNTKEYKHYIQNYLYPSVIKHPASLADMEKHEIKYFLEKLSDYKNDIIKNILNLVYYKANNVSKLHYDSQKIKYIIETLINFDKQEFYNSIKKFISEIVSKQYNGGMKSFYSYIIQHQLMNDDVVLNIGKIIHESIKKSNNQLLSHEMFSINLMLEVNKFELFDVIPEFLPENKKNIDDYGYSVDTWMKYIKTKESYYSKKYKKNINIQIEKSSKINYIIQNLNSLMDKNIKTWRDFVYSVSPDRDFKKALINFHEAVKTLKQSGTMDSLSDGGWLTHRLTSLFAKESPNEIQSHVLFIMSHAYDAQENYFRTLTSQSHDRYDELNLMLDYFYAMKNVWPNMIFDDKNINYDFIFFTLSALEYDKNIGMWLINQTQENVLLYNINSYFRNVFPLDTQIKYAKKIIHDLEYETETKFPLIYNDGFGNIRTFLIKLFANYQKYKKQFNLIFKYITEDMPVGKIQMRLLYLAPELQAYSKGGPIYLSIIKFALSEKVKSYFISVGNYQDWISMCKKLIRNIYVGSFSDKDFEDLNLLLQHTSKEVRKEILDSLPDVIKLSIHPSNSYNK